MLHAIAQYAPEDGNGYIADEVHAMQRTVINVFARWGVTDTDAATLLGGFSAKTFKRWKKAEYGRVDRDLADRMSNILGIHKALRIVFSDSARGYKWISTPNKAFNGLSALDVMKAGGMGDLMRIRRYLDSVRGGW